MRTPDILRAMAQASAPLGFSCDKLLCWKARQSITTVSELQRSGRYKKVSVGLVPTLHIKQSRPPSSRTWSVCISGNHLPLGHESILRSMMFDFEHAIPPADIAEPMRALFQWVDETWSSDERIRKDVLDNAEWCRKFVVYPVLRDWANGRLREPLSYWPDEPYYAQ